MAFLGKIGNIVRQNVAKHSGSDLQSSRLSICHTIRLVSSLSSPKLYVGGLSYSTDDQSLRDAFTKYGEVIEARVIVDRETGRSRGFGFITYTSSEEASSAIQALDGQDLHGRLVKVNYANGKTQGYGAGGFGGAYGVNGGGYRGAGGYGGGGKGGYGGGDGNGGYSGTGYGYSSGGNYAGNYGSGGGNAQYGQGSSNQFGRGAMREQMHHEHLDTDDD